MNSMFEWNFADSTLIWAANLFLQLTLITSLTLIVAAFCRRRPVLRHSVLCCGLLLLLVSPVTALLTQNVAWKLFRAESVAGWIQEPQKQVEQVSVEKAVAPPPVPSKGRASAASSKEAAPRTSPPNVPVIQQKPAPPVAVSVPNLAAHNPSEKRSLENVADQDANSSVQDQSQDQLLGFLRSVVPPLLLGWAAVTVWLIGRVIIAWIRLRRVVVEARPISDSAARELHAEVCTGMGMVEVPELRSSSDVASPIVAGVLRPRVILPETLLDQIHAQSLRQVLTHEAAHVARRDPAIALIQRLAAALFWPHPLVHLLNRQLAGVREEVCDNHVLANSEPAEYGRTLLSLADSRHAARPLAGAVGLFESRGALETRVAKILEETRDRSTRLTHSGMAVLALFFTGTASLALGVGVTWGAESARVASTEAESKTPAEDHEPKIQLLNQVAAGAKAAHERLRNWSGRGTYIATSSWKGKGDDKAAVVRRVADIQFAIDTDNDAWFVKWDEREPTRLIGVDGSSQLLTANLLHFHSIFKGGDWLDLRTSSAHESDEPAVLGAKYQEKPRILIIHPRMKVETVRLESEGLIDPQYWTSLNGRHAHSLRKFFWEEFEWLKRLHYQGHKVDVFAYCDVTREETSTGVVVRVKQYFGRNGKPDRNDPQTSWRELTFKEQFGYAVTKLERFNEFMSEVVNLSYAMRAGVPVPVKFSRKTVDNSRNSIETVEVELNDVQTVAEIDSQHFNEATFGLEDGDRVFDEHRDRGFVIEGGARILKDQNTQSMDWRPEVPTSLSQQALSGAQWNALLREYVEIANSWERTDLEQLTPIHRELMFKARRAQWEGLADRMIATHQLRVQDDKKHFMLANNLAMVVRMQYAGYNADKAAAMLVREGLQGEEEQWFALTLGYSDSTPLAAERVLRGMLEQCESRTTQAQARMSLARFLVDIAEKKRMVDALPSRMANVVQEYGGWYLNRLNAFDPAVAEREAETLWRQVIDEFPDVMDVQQKEKLAVRAESELRRLQHAIGRTAPEIVGQDFNGRPLKLSDTNGKVRVLMFWGHWCGPCRKQYEHLRTLSERHAGQPFEVLGVCSDEKRESIQATVDSGQINWQFWWDGGEDRWRILQEWGLYGSPWIFVLDRDGVVRFAGLEGAELDDAVASLLQ